MCKYKYKNTYTTDIKKNQACYAGCAQTLPNATPPIGKVHPFSKMANTFEPIFMSFRIKNVLKPVQQNLLQRCKGLRRTHCPTAV